MGVGTRSYQGGSARLAVAAVEAAAVLPRLLLLRSRGWLLWLTLPPRQLALLQLLLKFWQKALAQSGASAAVAA